MSTSRRQLESRSKSIPASFATVVCLSNAVNNHKPTMKNKPMWLRSRKRSTMSCLLLILTQVVAADVKELSTAVLGDQPIWMQNRSADIVLNFSKADPHFRHPSLGTVPVRGKDMKVMYHIGFYHGNVAIVRYGTQFLLAVRKMHFYKTPRTALENYPLSDKKGEEDQSAACGPEA